jgi:hypothetical protein
MRYKTIRLLVVVGNSIFALMLLGGFVSLHRYRLGVYLFVDFPIILSVVGAFCGQLFPVPEPRVCNLFALNGFPRYPQMWISCAPSRGRRSELPQPQQVSASVFLTVPNSFSS